jgi:hypothetical protein
MKLNKIQKIISILTLFIVSIIFIILTFTVDKFKKTNNFAIILFSSITAIICFVSLIFSINDYKKNKIYIDDNNYTNFGDIVALKQLRELEKNENVILYKKLLFKHQNE